MRISDWSSDVCSSDLVGLAIRRVDCGIDAADVAPAAEHREDPVGNTRIVEALEFRLRPVGDPLVPRTLRGAVFGDERIRIGRTVVGVEWVEFGVGQGRRSEEHTSELQSLMRISYAVFCLRKKKKKTENIKHDRENTM